MVSWYLRYSVVLVAARLVNILVSMVAPRWTEKKSLNVAMPSIVKSSTRNVLEILNLFVARKVKPMSPSVLGRLAFDGMLYRPRIRVLGGASWPVILVAKLTPLIFSRNVEFEVALL